MNDATEPVERWLPVPGYEGVYEVSDLGRVRSLDRVIVRSDGRTQRVRGRMLSICFATDGGYPVVALAKNGSGRPHTVHNLVTRAFLGPMPDGLEVRHLDGDPTNCRLSNLAYGTHSENMFDQARHGTHWLANRVVCPYRHALARPNLVVSRLPHRICLACARGRAATQSARKRGVILSHQQVSDERYRAIMTAA